MTDALADVFDGVRYPRSMQVEDVRVVAGGASVIVYDLAEGRLRGAWMRPDGRVHAWTNDLSTPISDLLSEIADDHGEAPEWLAEDHRALARLAPICDALLPPAVQDHLASAEPEHRMIVVPSGRLWRVPWALLPAVDGQPLVARASVSLVPSLSFYAALQYERGTSGTEWDTYVYRPEFNPTWPSSLRQPVDRPDLGAYTGAHNAASPLAASALMTHGFARPVAGGPFDQYLVDHVDPPNQLSAGAAFNLYFPPVVVLGACLSSRVDDGVGREPVGLSTALLSRGARHVIGSVWRPHTEACDRMAAGVLKLWNAGSEPALALAAWQRSRHKKGSLPHYWAGFVHVGSFQR